MKRSLKILLLVLFVLQTGCGGGNGDRVLVAKYMYDPASGPPERYDVVVFRYPKRPLGDLDNNRSSYGVPTNYIKRLLGLAGETLAIFFGQLFHATDLNFSDKGKVDDMDLWEKEHMHMNHPEAQKAFTDGKFEILRKPPRVMLAMRRIVYDNDHQAADLKAINFPPRWSVTGSSWSLTPNNDTSFTHQGGTGAKEDWLRYQHILRPNGPLEGNHIPEEAKKPRLITDFSSYNSSPSGNANSTEHWAGDLMLELELKVEKGDGEFWLELARGVDRFQARWDLSNGQCTLWRLSDVASDKEEKLASAATAVHGPGTYQIRLANFDERLTLWVNQTMPFGDGVAYKRPWFYDRGKWVHTGPRANDLKPASLASKGAAVQVNHLKLWRDTYYTVSSGQFDHSDDAVFGKLTTPQDWSDPTIWEANGIDQLPFGTMYVQPGHYLCLGDNSPQSSDSRAWGLVPERLMLGRALVVYYPFNRIEVIH